MKKVRFTTLAELQETYPVGSVIGEIKREVSETRVFYNKKDYNALLESYDYVEPIDDMSCLCKGTLIYQNKVDGYVYDGECWYPAKDTWDGWVPYDEGD